MTKKFSHALLFLAAMFLFVANSVCSCVESEGQALLKFKACFDDTYARLMSTWDGNDCCKWEGVGCHKNSNRVVSLKLRGKEDDDTGDRKLEVSGSSGDDFALFLVELRFLEYLDLSGNEFNGYNISPSLGLMEQLRYLNLSYAGFGGEIPHQLGNLTWLRILDLKSSSGYLQAPDIRWISQLRSLQQLDMQGVDLSRATSPNAFQVLNNLPSLTTLILSWCGLNSSHLSLGNYPFSSTFLGNIKLLDLSGNSINGPVPVFISNMTSLEFLDLSNVNFVESKYVIPNELGQLKRLRYLHLAGNDFVGPIPTWIKDNMFAFRGLDLSYNQLTGGIPNNVEHPAELEYLYLGNNHLNGSIPDSIGQLSKLEILDLSSNQLTGSIPASIGQLFSLKRFLVSKNSLEGVVSEAHFANLSNLTHLDIGFNRLNCELKSDWRPSFHLLQYVLMNSCKLGTRFPKWIQLQNAISRLDLSNTSISGSIPENIGSMMPELNELNLADNNINGSIPESLGNLQSLELLDISNNMLSGNIPNSIGQLHLLDLLLLNNNSLNGELPLTLANCTNLLALDLGENALSGNITWIGESLEFLECLRLRKNKFAGDFPSQLCTLSSLRILDLAGNRLSGKLPPCFLNLTCMIGQTCGALGGGYQQERVVEVMKGRYLEYKSQVVLMLTILDLSDNNFNGSIPKEIASLTGLIGLNISHNHLSGEIPENIGQMMNLEALDLSQNDLSGKIPSSLSDITTLSYLNLSRNNLSGTIPKGNQLQTLDDPTIYIGNPLLCGAPLLTKCPGDEKPSTTATSRSKDNNEDAREKLWFSLIVMSGFATGLWGVIGVLIFMKTWRQALFRMVDNAQDRIHVTVSLKMKRFKKMLNRNPDDE